MRGPAGRATPPDYAAHGMRPRTGLETMDAPFPSTAPRRSSMPHVTTDDGTQIFYTDWGTSGSPVLLSHGWPLNSDAWEAAAHFFADHGHRAIAHDRRGHGR